MKRIALLSSMLLLSLWLGAQERVPLWPKGKMGTGMEMFVI